MPQKEKKKMKLSCLRCLILLTEFYAGVLWGAFTRRKFWMRLVKLSTKISAIVSFSIVYDYYILIKFDIDTYRIGFILGRIAQGGQGK